MELSLSMTSFEDLPLLAGIHHSEYLFYIQFLGILHFPVYTKDCQIIEVEVRR